MILFRDSLVYQAIKEEGIPLNTEARKMPIFSNVLSPVISSKSFVFGERLPSKGGQISVQFRKCTQSGKQILHPTQRDWQLAPGECWIDETGEIFASEKRSWRCSWPWAGSYLQI